MFLFAFIVYSQLSCFKILINILLSLEYLQIVIHNETKIWLLINFTFNLKHTVIVHITYMTFYLLFSLERIHTINPI